MTQPLTKELLVMVIGKHISEIETPALIIDLDKLDNNINKLAAYFKTINCKLRPHFKTHKCPIIAHKQIRAGAIGITCAKLGEAEILAKSGIEHILIANQVIEAGKISRLAGIAKYCDIIVAVDNPDNVSQLSRAASSMNSCIGILIEVDTGMGRCGVRNKERCLKLAEQVKNSSGLVLRGVMGYEGHCVLVEDINTRKTEAEKAIHSLIEYKNFLEAEGYDIKIVSGAGTGTHLYSSRITGMTEIQAGSYVFMDTRYGLLKDLDFEQSLYILSTIISKPCDELAIIDSGMKSMTHDNGLPGIIHPAGMELIKMSEEHGKVKVDSTAEHASIGDKVKIIPSHCCTTVNLHNVYYVVSNDIVVAEWEISARGKFV